MATFVLKSGKNGVHTGDITLYLKPKNFEGEWDDPIEIPERPSDMHSWNGTEWILDNTLLDSKCKQEIVFNIRKTMDIDDELALLRKAVLALSNNEVLPQEIIDLTTTIETTKTNFATALAASKVVESKVIVEEVIVPPIIGDSSGSLL